MFAYNFETARAQKMKPNETKSNSQYIQSEKSRERMNIIASYCFMLLSLLFAWFCLCVHTIYACLYVEFILYLREQYVCLALEVSRVASLRIFVHFSCIFFFRANRTEQSKAKQILSFDESEMNSGATIQFYYTNQGTRTNELVYLHQGEQSLF